MRKFKIFLHYISFFAVFFFFRFGKIPFLNKPTTISSSSSSSYSLRFCARDETAARASAGARKAGHGPFWWLSTQTMCQPWRTEEREGKNNSPTQQDTKGAWGAFHRHWPVCVLLHFNPVCWKQQKSAANAQHVEFPLQSILAEAFDSFLFH